MWLWGAQLSEKSLESRFCRYFCRWIYRGIKGEKGKEMKVFFFVIKKVNMHSKISSDSGPDDCGHLSVFIGSCNKNKRKETD